MSGAPEDSAELLRQQMEVVRRELHYDAEGVVDTARELTDWKYYVQSYPWACLGAAALVGYALVPQKINVMRPTSKQLAALAKKQHLVVQPDNEDPKVSGWKGKLVTFASNMAMRAALAYIGQQFGKQAGHQAAEAADESSQPFGYVRK